MDFFGLFNGVKDLASEAIEDVDKRNAFISKADKMEQELYLAALQTQTVPWVDALHKMARPTISILGMVIPAFLIYFNPDINPLTLGAILTPAGIYNGIKGRGK